MGNKRVEQMEKIAAGVLDLEQSPLYEYRKEHHYHPVIGEGDLHAKIMFIGEAPGLQEAKSGRPFVGASGRVLDDLITSIGLTREDVYITNIVKDRPPENRDPTQEEVDLYSPFLIRQIELLQPRVIATLGRFAMDFILELFDLPQAGRKISQLHGQVIEARASYGEVYVIPLFHPAVTLYNRDQRTTLEEDFLKLKGLLKS